MLQSVRQPRQLDDLDEKNHFDEAPFRMGGFDSIVRSGKIDFTVGGTFEDHCHASASFTFRAKAAHLSTGNCIWVWRGKGERLKTFGLPLRMNPRPFSGLVYPTLLSICVGRNLLLVRSPPGCRVMFAKAIFLLPVTSNYSGRKQASRAPEGSLEFVKFINFLKRDFPFPAPGSFVVSAPDPAPPDRERSYRVPPTHLTSEGFGAPYEFLSEVGEKLSLWRNISFANGPGTNGTEVMVETAPNVWHNLVDAGHGIHSLLPWLAYVAGQPPDAVVLLQQPEVHVHPRTQAELAQWMAESDRSFMIETHSDHLVDRFRICVMKGILAPEDLSIVYFQPSEDRTQSRIHGIGVDDHGNLEGPPPEYRTFFLEETHDLLGIG